MIQDIHPNSQICSMIAEGEVAKILSHFDSDYVMSIINDQLNNRFTYSSSIMTKPNIVVSYDMTFKSLLETYPTDRDNILTVRQEAYKEIIDTICRFYNFTYNDPAEDVDRYTIAYYLYECFVSKFDEFICNFFANFIILNKDAIYDGLELANYKKDKDVTTLYGKKAYEDIKMAIIASKFNMVLYYLKGLDIDISSFITSCYPIEIASFICNSIDSLDFYKNHMSTAIDIPSIVTDIKLKIHQSLSQPSVSYIETLIGEDNTDDNNKPSQAPTN